MRAGRAIPARIKPCPGVGSRKGSRRAGQTGAPRTHYMVPTWGWRTLRNSQPRKTHGRSDFRAPPRHRLDEASTRQVMHALPFRDCLWRNRWSGEQLIPGSRGRVLKDLPDVAVKASQVFPAHAAIGNSGCSEPSPKAVPGLLRENGGR